MKRLIVFLCLTVPVLAAPVAIAPLEEETIVRSLAVKGAICRIYGHRWSDCTSMVVLMSNPPQYPPQQRRCDFCGRIEVKAPAVWAVPRSAQ